jgi:hypothetical protein
MRKYLHTRLPKKPTASSSHLAIHRAQRESREFVEFKFVLTNETYSCSCECYGGVAELPSVSRTWEAIRVICINCRRTVAKEFLMKCLDYCLILERPGKVNVSLQEHELGPVD